MGKPKAPPPPDYTGAAAAQGQANLDVAKFNAATARPNEINPEGNRTWSIRPGADPKNPQPGDYILTTTLSPEQQRLYEGQNQLSQGLLDTGTAGLDRVSQVLGQQFGVGGMPASQRVGGANLGVTGVNPGALPDAPQLRTGIDTAGIPELQTSANAVRDQVTAAMLERSRPEMERSAAAARARQIATGADVGSASNQTVEDQIARNENDFRLASILAGDDAAAKQISQQLALRSQGFGERQAQAGFENSALAQMFSQGLARGGQEFGQNLQAGQFANDTVRAQQGLDLQAAGFNNDQRADAIAEALMLRQLPLNEINALRTGAQVNPPQFTAGGPSGNAQAAPIFDAATAQSAYNAQKYGQDLNSYNQMLNTGLMAAMMYFSDARLKKDVKQVGTLDDGSGVYTWKWNETAKMLGADKAPAFGVIAQEHPESAARDPFSGFLMVDYSKLG